MKTMYQDSRPEVSPNERLTAGSSWLRVSPDGFIVQHAVNCRWQQFPIVPRCGHAIPSSICPCSSMTRIETQDGCQCHAHGKVPLRPKIKAKYDTFWLFTIVQSLPFSPHASPQQQRWQPQVRIQQSVSATGLRELTCAEEESFWSGTVKVHEPGAAAMRLRPASLHLRHPPQHCTSAQSSPIR